MVRLHLLLAIILSVSLFPPARAQAQEAFFRPALNAKDIEATLGTDWYGVYLQNKKIGYGQVDRARAGDTVIESLLVTMKLAAAGQKAEMKMTRSFTFEAKPPHRLLKATMEKFDGSSTTKINAKRVDKGFEYVLSSVGKERTKQVAEPEFNLADSIAADVWLRSNPKVGDKVRVRDLDLEDWTLDPSEHKIQGTKNGLAAGVEVKYYEVETKNTKDKITFLSRFDSTGTMLSTNLAIFELRKETEKEAKNTEFSQDLFVLGLAKIDRKIGHTTRLTELVIEVNGKDGNVLNNGPRQTVIVENGARRLKLGKKYGNELKVGAKEIEENLEETNAFAIADPEVKALAKKAVGDAKTPEEKVKRIVAFVHDFVEPVAAASLPNIHDLLEKKKGDCKSYALLTTTLCRAAGVPSREVAGLLYIGDDAKAFGGHAWNEVVLNGVWVPVDASLNQVELDAGHISFGEDRAAPGAMLQSLGKLSFKVIEAQSSK
jgi:protein-glutamine gamma-glutamyltransferase